MFMAHVNVTLFSDTEPTILNILSVINVYVNVTLVFETSIWNIRGVIIVYVNVTLVSEPTIFNI
jgi:hypothetical protein